MALTPKLLVLLAGGLLLAGCTPDFARVELTPITSPPLDVTVSAAQVEIPVGIAVAVNVLGYDEDDDPVGNIRITPPASITAGVIETAEPEMFILYGQSHGTGSLSFTSIEVSGTVNVPVSIVPQQ